MSISVQITEIKVQYYSVRITISTSSSLIIQLESKTPFKGVFEEILFTRIYLGEKCKCAIFLKKRKKKTLFFLIKSIKWRCFGLLKCNGTIKMNPENNGKKLVKIKLKQLIRQAF